MMCRAPLRLALTLGVASAALATGCGDAAPLHDAGVFADAADTSAAQDTVASDAAWPADTQPTPDTVPAVDTAPTGPRSVGVGVLLGEIDSDFVNVAFVSARLTRAVPPPDTGGTVYGACRVTTIDPDAPTAGTYGLDAGALSIVGTSPAVTLSPVDEGVYGTGYAASVPGDQVDLMPAGGAIIQVTGVGGADIAALSGVVQAPEPVTIVLPRTGLGRSVDPRRDLMVTWNAGTGETVLVSLTPIGSGGDAIKGKAAFCLVVGDPGSLVIPKDALIELTGVGTPRMALGVTRTRTGSATSAEHSVPLTATRSSGGPVRLVPQ